MKKIVPSRTAHGATRGVRGALAAALACALAVAFSARAEEAGAEGEAPAAERLAALDADEARLRAAYSGCVARLDKPARGIVVPVETFPGGATKVAATAELAQFFREDGLVWCGDVTVREFTEDGSLRATFTASGCVMDRKTKSGWLEGEASARFGGTSLSGDGIYFSVPDEVIRIASRVEVVSTEIKFEGVKL